MTDQDTLLETIRRAGPVTTNDLKELKYLCKQSVFLRFLCQMLIDSDEAVSVLANIDLTTDEGVKKAISIQTRAQQLAGIVSSFTDLVTQPVEENEDDNN